MGAVAAPCVGPFVGALVAVVAAVGSVLLGAAAFFTVGIGLGIPYVFLGIFTSLINRFPRGGGWLVWTKRLMGLALAGVILYFVERFIRREFFWPLVLGLFLFAGVYLGLLEGLSRRPFTRRFLAVRLATGAALVAAGVYVYAAGSAERPELPWQPWTPDALQAAQAARRPAVLYFGADWCIACREWKAKVFGPIAEAARARPARIPGEKHDILWLYIDVTVLGEGPKKEFARRFDAVNPPAVVLLGRDGKAVAAYRDPPDLETFVKALLEAHTAGRGDKIL
jgi:thiol:disulfide interchange protein DsbD